MGPILFSGSYFPTLSTSMSLWNEREVLGREEGILLATVWHTQPLRGIPPNTSEAPHCYAKNVEVMFWLFFLLSFVSFIAFLLWMGCACPQASMMLVVMRQYFNGRPLSGERWSSSPSLSSSLMITLTDFKISLAVLFLRLLATCNGNTCSAYFCFAISPKEDSANGKTKNWK